MTAQLLLSHCGLYLEGLQVDEEAAWRLGRIVAELTLFLVDLVKVARWLQATHVRPHVCQHFLQAHVDVN